MKKAGRSDHKRSEVARDLLIAFIVAIICIFTICLIGAALVLGEKISEDMIPLISAIALILGIIFSVIAATRGSVLNPWIATASIAGFIMIMEVILACILRSGAGKVWPVLLCNVIGILMGVLISSFGRMHKKKHPKFRNR